MKIKMNRNIGRILLAGACATALAVGTAVPAFAVEGITPVTYSSNQQVPGVNGWGFEIPTSIPFGADKSITVSADVGLFNVTPGGSIGDVTTFPSGGVELSLKSTNSFKLITDAEAPTEQDPVEYKIGYVWNGQNEVVFDSTTLPAGKAIATFTKEHPKAKGTATRLKDAKKSGTHTDSLTYTFTDSNGTGGGTA